MSSLALIAHDNNRETLNRFELVATRHTARLLERKVGLAVQELLSGPRAATPRSPRWPPSGPSTPSFSSWTR